MINGDAEHSHGHGGGQPQLQHHDIGHSLGQQGGGHDRAVPRTFKDLCPHNYKPTPTLTVPRPTISRGNINYYFKTSDGAASRIKPNHPT